MTETAVETLRLFDVEPLTVTHYDFKRRDGGPTVWTETVSEKPLTHDDVTHALYLYHSQPWEWSKDSQTLFQWLRVSELNVHTGWGSGGGGPQHIDLWCLNTWRKPWRGYRPRNRRAGTDGDNIAVAYEVKISRADFLRELKAPEKRQAAMRLSDAFYFACTPGVAKPEEIPEGCGLVVVGREERLNQQRDWRYEWVVRAPQREKEPPPWSFICALGRRLEEAADNWERKGNPLAGTKAEIVA